MTDFEDDRPVTITITLWNQIMQLRKERDEARRESCVWGSRTERGAHSLARFRGWDCYKEETQ